MRRLRWPAGLAALAWTVSAAGGAEPSRLPRVVLLGDATRLGYGPLVAERLKGVAEVLSDPADDGDTRGLQTRLNVIVALQPAVIHVNAGLYDVTTDPKSGTRQVELPEYEASLRAILTRLERETSARLIFATTTPVIDERQAGRREKALRKEADVLAYNRAALGVIERFPVVGVNDLHALVVRLGPEKLLEADGVRLTRAGLDALAEQVVSAVKAALEGPPVLREVACRRARSPLVIDGVLDEPAWADAQVIDRFPAYWANKPGPGTTRARLLWDDEALYYGAAMDDAELRSFGTKRNDRLWEGDVFELFFKPKDDRPEYYEFQVNPRSVPLELPFPRRDFDFETLAAGPSLGMKAVAVANGTVDRPGDLDRGWTVEGRIPWSAFTPTGGRPRTGDTWRFALCRYDYGPEGTKPVLMSSAPLTRGSFHRYEDYGRLRFEGPRP